MAAYLRSGRLLTLFRSHQKFNNLFSSVSWSAFDEMPLETSLVERLNDLKITKLTEIQQKSLGPILKGESVIINAETGSGKTLCYLLPLINRILKKKHSGPSAVVLVPNMDLGHQVTRLVNELLDPGLFACPLHRTSQLRVNGKYPMIVSTPQTLMLYNPKSLFSIQTVVIDEADLIILNGGKRFWKLLQSFQDRSNFAKNGDLGGTNVQFIFAAATLPRRGEKSVFRRILNQFPGINYVSSTRVHRYVPNLRNVDVFVKEEAKLPQLLKCLNILSGGLPFDDMDSWNEFETSSNVDNISTATENTSKGEHLSSQPNNPERILKVLVFANTVSMADKIYKFLNFQEADSTFELADKTTDYKDSTKEIRPNVRHYFGEDYIKTAVRGKKDFVTKTGPTSSWRSKVGILHKDMSRDERQEVLKKFHRNEVEILVSTDLASRGLDILDVSHVVQVDYALNAADTLHRAGRTARAGNSGTVINFITENDKDLWKAIKQADERIGNKGFQDIFSRNRQFSRRIKKKMSRVNKSIVNDQ